MNGAQHMEAGGKSMARDRVMALLHAGFWLTGINFVASVGHFGYQLVMAHMLDSSEFTSFNTTLGLVNLLVVPLAAASQAITHDLAWHHANDNQRELKQLQAACQKLLRRLTWIISLLALVLIQPLTSFFNFPRGSLALVALACVPITMWSTLGSVWCAGLSRFNLLAALNFGTMAARVISGIALVYFFPTAEAAVGATFVAGWVLASVVLFYPMPKVSEPVGESPWNKEFIFYLGAALLVGLGNFIFCFSDQLVAQRNTDGYYLDAYVKAGLLARAVFWGSQPLLVVYFTQRSGKEHSTRGSISLWFVYVAVVIVGLVMLLVLRKPLCHLLLQRDQIQNLLPMMLQDLKRFALIVLPIGVLQGLGFYYLASEKLVESYLFGILGMLYFAVLILFGHSIDMMLSLMFGGAIMCLLTLLLAAVIRWGRHQP